MEKDYFSILGLPRGAKREEIIRAYRKLAARYHPDKHQGNPLADLAEEKFKEINEAYHALVGDDFIYTAPPVKTGKEKPPENVPPAAQELIDKGMNCIYEGSFTKAIDLFTQALKISKTAKLHNLLGIAYCEIGEYRKALQPLVRATELDDTSERYFFDAGYAYYQLKVWESAITYLLKAYDLIEDDKKLAVCCIYIAICNYNIGKTARSEFFLEEAVNYDPENASYRILLNEFRESQEGDSRAKKKTLTRLNRFTFTTSFEESLGNLFHTLFSK